MARNTYQEQGPLLFSSGIRYVIDSNQQVECFEACFSPPKYSGEKWKFELARRRYGKSRYTIQRLAADSMVNFGRVTVLIEFSGHDDAKTKVSRTCGEKSLEKHEFDRAGSTMFVEVEIGELSWFPNIFCTCTILLSPSPPRIVTALSKLFSDQREEFGDMMIRAGEEKLRIYKGIVSERSPVLKVAFLSDMNKESREACYDMTDTTPAVVKEMLHYMYTDQCPHLPDMAFDLLVAAENYEITDLKMMCERYLVGNLSVENATRTLIGADQHNARTLKRKSLEFMKVNLGAMNENETFKTDMPRRLFLELLTVIENDAMAAVYPDII